MALICIGIDPGITGAVAILRCEPTTSVMKVLDTPTELEKVGKKQKLAYRPVEMAHMLRPFGGLVNPNTVYAFMEKVGAMPGQGVVSMFGFGKGFGIWLGILAGLQIRHTLVTPQAWKKEMMSGFGDKDAARGRLQELYPGLVEDLSRKKDIGRADAGLIAEYGRRIIYRENAR